MKSRIEELHNRAAVDYMLSGDPHAIRHAITTAVNEALELAAKECLKIWKESPNTRESGFRQNEISHGCVASAEAIRKMKL